MSSNGSSIGRTRVRGGWARGFLQLVVLGVGLLALPRIAGAQQEAKFAGWTSDGYGVVEDVNLERSLKCVPKAFNASQAAPGKGCTPCAGKKACAIAQPATPGSDSADGAVHVEPAKESKAILLVTVKGEAAPRKLALKAGRSARVTTWFRPDSKALAILVHDAEDRIFVVDLGGPAKK